MQLKERVAIVTGAAQGIGREIALTLAKEGASLGLCDINKGALDQTQKEAASCGVKALSFVVDVTNVKQVEDMVNKVLDNLGKVDILINNAGITRDSLIMRMKEADWDAVLGVNLKGTFNCIKAVTRPMVKQRSGTIINISSVVGFSGNPGQVNYSSTKSALVGFTKSLAREVGARGVTVNAVAPGFIDTAMTQALNESQQQTILQQIPLGRMGDADDIANAVTFLASKEASYITGTILHVNGGMY